MKGLALFTIIMIPIILIIGFVLIGVLLLILVDPGILLPFFISSKKKKNQENDVQEQPMIQPNAVEQKNTVQKSDEMQCGYQICSDQSLLFKQTNAAIDMSEMYPCGKKTSWDEDENDTWAEMPVKDQPVLQEEKDEETEGIWEGEIRETKEYLDTLAAEEEEEEEERMEEIDDLILLELMSR